MKDVLYSQLLCLALLSAEGELVVLPQKDAKEEALLSGVD